MISMFEGCCLRVLLIHTGLKPGVNKKDFEAEPYRKLLSRLQEDFFAAEQPFGFNALLLAGVD